MITANLTRYELESANGLFAFTDPCLLDDGVGLLDPIELIDYATSALTHVRFAQGSGRYQVEVCERELEGWGRRVCRVELKPADEPDSPDTARAWQPIGWVAVDTGTLVAFDPELLAETIEELSFDDLFLLDSRAGCHGVLPKPSPCLFSTQSGLGDGGYDVEVDGPSEAARAVRITFIPDDGA